MAGKDLIIDTNLLLVLVIGTVQDGRQIKNSNRLNAFGPKDMDVILEVMKSHRNIYITPYIATEVSNLIDLGAEARTQAYEAANILFSAFTQIATDISEDSIPPLFARYGITDASLVSLASDYVIFTDDRKLLGALYAVNPDNVLPYEDAKRFYYQ